MPSRWPATATSKSEGKKTMKYPCLPGLTPDGTVYQNSAMGTVEAMLPPGPWATAHAPALLETPDGSLLCAWFAGSFEGSGDVSIVCARLPKGAARWEAPVQVSHDEKRSEQNPSLFLAPDGAVWAVYTAQLDRVPGKDNMQFTSVIRRQKVRTAAVPGANRMCCLPGREASAASPSRCLQVDAGYSQTGCAATAHPVWPETRRRFRSPTIRAVPGAL